MKLYVIGNRKIDVFKLNTNEEESFSAIYEFDKDYKFSLNAEKVNDKWIVRKNENIRIAKDGQEVSEIELFEYNSFTVSVTQKKAYLKVFCMPNFENETYDLDLNNVEKIVIGNNEKCNIYYNNFQFGNMHIEISKLNDKFLVVNNGEKDTLFVNNKEVSKKELNVGDVIFINGFRLIWMSSFIRINNPQKNVKVNGLNLYDLKEDNTNYQEDNNSAYNITANEDYFYHTLKINNKLNGESVVIDPPPAGQTGTQMPFILTIGTMITMLASSFFMGYNAISGIFNGTKTLMSSLPQLIMVFAMVVGSVIIPSISRKYQKKVQQKQEKLRQKKYTEYLGKKQEEIEKIIAAQEQLLKTNNPSAIECHQMFVNNNINNIYFWSRTISDDDFLTVRLGIGTEKSMLEVQAPEEHFTLEEDNLLSKVYEVVEKSKYLYNVPITFSLTKNNKTALLIPKDSQIKYLNNLIIQLITLHSPMDLKIVVLADDDVAEELSYIKYLPHNWSDDKTMRFFATNIEEMQLLSSYLEKEYKGRKNGGEQETSEETVAPDTEDLKKDEAYKKHEPYYLIIDTNYRKSQKVNIVSLLLKTVSNFGFSYLGIGNQLKELSTDSTIFLNVNDKKGDILKKNINPKEIVSFNREDAEDIDFYIVVKKLANIPISSKELLSTLPQAISFLEMFDVSKIEQLNISSRWKTNNPVLSLATTVGVHTNGEKFKLDLHEKFHGPHGLIAGMTGSGKSEFIITYILSMIVNYHPYEVQFVLIDYKGGGLAGAFQNKELQMKIPHLVGTITNLDTSEMNRTLVSIQSELTRRQRKFNEVRDKLGEGTIDIYKYQKLYREGVIKEPMAHLFIICDEFAELKAQQPEFMQQLISTSRIGRSLWINLILSTQKPSGVVNEQIWSNSKFKVCLKVQDKSDSNEMLKKPDAANLKDTGRFYLQVGYDDYFDIGQSGWSGAKYVSSDNIVKKVDDAINFIDNIGNQIKTINQSIKVDNQVNLGDQLTNIVKYICNLGKRENLKISQLWLDALPETIYLTNLIKKYNYTPKPYLINPVIGEYDNPAEQQQGLLKLDLTNEGNTLIYGQNGSGKESLLTTIISSTVLYHTPEEVNFYILDFGAETLQIFKNIPHVGDVATVEEPEKVVDTFEMLLKEMDRRKELFSDYSGNYIDYCENSGKKLPLIVTIINNYEIFAENNSKLAEGVQNIYRDASKYGIIFIITSVSVSGVRGRMTQYFNNKICLKIATDDYRSILNSPRGLVPSNFFGRGIVKMGDTGYEFQSAILIDKVNLNNYIRKVSTYMNQSYKVRAPKIPTLPQTVLLNETFNENDTAEQLPIGYELYTKQIYKYNFEETVFTPVLTSAMTNERMSFVYSLINMFSKVKNINTEVIDLIQVYEKSYDNAICHNKDFDKVIVDLYNKVISSKNSNKTNMFIILGIGQIKKVLSPKSLELLTKLFTDINNSYNSHFIIVDTYVSYRNIQNDIWVNTNVNSLYGIWLGEDVGSQSGINLNNLKMEERKLNFPYIAYAVKNGNHKIIKHIVEEVDTNEG